MRELLDSFPDSASASPLEGAVDAVNAHPRVEKFDTRATESFESLNDQNSVKILSEFRKNSHKFSEIVKI